MDVLRGFALFGIFVVNLPSLALTSDVAYAPEIDGPHAESIVWAVMTGLFMAKFFALFSTLFGMGLVLQMQRAERSGRDFTRFYKRRLAILAVIGLAHGTFLYAGDILFVYSVAGFVLYLCRRCRTATCLVAAAVLMIIGTSLTLAGASWEASPGEGSVATIAPTWEPEQNITGKELAASGDEHWSAFERKAYAEGPYRSTLLVNIVSYIGWLVASSLFSFNWQVLAYFFVGAALMKSGFLATDRAALPRRMAVIGLSAGLPLVAWSTFDQWTADAEFGSGPLTVIAGDLGCVLLAAGYLGTIVVTVRSGRLPRTSRALAAAGRMALTNYLVQSMVGNVLFRWYGFDLYGELSRLQLVGVAVAVFVAQVGFSVLWLRRFSMGPFEWAWRRMTYLGSPQKT